MTRWLFPVVAIAVGASAASCNTPACGQGTKQVQNKDGSVQCVVVDAQPATIECDEVNGGVQLVGAKCVARRSCDPASTTEVNGVCIGTASGDAPPICPPPAAGAICVNGLIRDFLDNKIHKSRIHVSFYDPSDLLLGVVVPKKELDTDSGGFVFADQAPTSTGLIVIAVGDADHKNTVFVNAATGARDVTAGKSVRVDGYALLKSTADGWKAGSGGYDWVTNGGYLARFFSDPKPPGNVLAATETSPVPGVQLTEAGAAKTPPNAYYFTDLSTVNGTATATTAAGAAIFKPAPQSLGNYSGSGGGISWEAQQGGSFPGIIFIARFHPN